MDNNITCRVWAHENTNGFYHRCHSENAGLAGHTYKKEEIKEKLEKAPIDIPGSGGIWEILACESNHDGAACKGCFYEPWKGLSHFYDLKKQIKALEEARNNGHGVK